MFSKDEELKKIDSAYQRIVISAGAYETEKFTNAISNTPAENRRICISEFIENYQGDSLFINYENMLQYYKPKEVLYILLSDMEDAEKDFFLYLYVPQEKLDVIKREFNEVFDYEKEWISELFDEYEEDNYIIKIDDKRSPRCFNYFKIYSGGKVYIFIDSDFTIKREEFYLDEDLKNELISEIKKKVDNLLKDVHYLLIDNREFLRTFVVTYGFEWLGLKCESGIDKKDYFLDKIPSKIIQKIMNLPTIKEIFVNAKHD